MAVGNVYHRLGAPVAVGRVHSRLGSSAQQQPHKAVCRYWVQGKCNRNPCPYLHCDPNKNNNKVSPPQLKPKPQPQLVQVLCQQPKLIPRVDKVCKYWMDGGKCRKGDLCNFQHQWSLGEGFSLVTTLTGHTKPIIGIALPSGSDKLCSGSQDSTVRVWDCTTGQSSALINLTGEVGSMISDGPWVFVGIPGLVKAWNTQTNAEHTLTGPVGQVHSLAVGDDVLYAGSQDGNILVRKFDEFDRPATSLKAHNASVVSLAVGRDNRLYSGSIDHNIKVWDLATLKLLQTLKGHTQAVTSLVCWEDYLISCSLDHTIKVWACSETGTIQVVYTHKEDHGLLALCGIIDAQANPILICSSNDDNTVRLYDLPSFKLRGKMFSKEETRTIQVGPGGLIFTGDATGELKVWKLSEA